MSAFKPVEKRQAKIRTPKERGMSQVWAFNEDRDIISAACREIGMTQMQMVSLMRQIVDRVVEIYRVQKPMDAKRRKMFTKAMFAAIDEALPFTVIRAQAFFDVLVADEDALAAQVGQLTPLSALNISVSMHDSVNKKSDVQ